MHRIQPPTRSTRLSSTASIGWSSNRELTTCQFQFTHQGAEWVEGSDAWLGTTWTGTAFQQQNIRTEMQFATNWSNQTGRPVLMGEFGAYETADMTSRSLWTQFVRQEAESRGFSWAYWEYGAGFGAYDREAHLWIPLLHNALAPLRTGDFNADYSFDCGDIDLLTSAIWAGQTIAWFDLNKDGALDRKDVDLWLLKAETLPGDANLDGAVDGSDFGIWNANKFRMGLPRGAVVPEPIFGWLSFCLGMLAAGGHRRGMDEVVA